MIKNIFRVFFYSGLFLLFFSSCSPLVQKAYFVESPNVALFDSVGQTNLNFSGQYFSHTNIQFSQSVSAKSGFNANMQIWYPQRVAKSAGLSYVFPRDPHPSYAMGFGAGYVFYHSSKNHYFEFTSNYGFLRNRTRVAERSLSPIAVFGLGGPWLSQDVDATFHTISLQPSFFWNDNGIKTGFVFRNEVVYIPDYYYFFEVSVYNPDLYYISNTLHDEISLSNKWAMNQQLFFVFRNQRKTISWGVHTGFSWSLYAMHKQYDFTHITNELNGVAPTKTPPMAEFILGFDVGVIW